MVETLGIVTVPYVGTRSAKTVVSALSRVTRPSRARVEMVTMVTRVQYLYSAWIMDVNTGNVWRCLAWSTHARVLSGGWERYVNEVSLFLIVF